MSLTDEEQEYLLLENISFDFDSFYRNTETKELFLKYLDEIYVSEQKSFVEKADKLTQERDLNTVKVLSQKIVEDHLMPHSKEAINVSQLETSKLQNVLHCSGLSEELKNSIFESIRKLSNQVLLTWHQDVFPRFVRSKLVKNWFTSLVNKNKVKASLLLREVSILRRVQNISRPDILFDESEFFGNPRCITDKEVQFFENLVQDAPFWRLVYADKSGTSVFETKKKFLKSYHDSKRRNYYSTKFLCYLPYDIGSLVNFVFSDGSNSDPNIEILIQLGYMAPTNANEYFTTNVDNLVNLGPLFQKRRILNNLSAVFLPLINTYVLVCRSFDVAPNNFKKSVKTLGVSYFALQKVDEKRTKYITAFVLNIGGVAQKVAAFMDKIHIDRCKMMKKHITEKMNVFLSKADASKPNSTWYNTNLFGGLSTLEDNCKSRFSKEQYPPFLNSEFCKYYPDRRADKVV